MVVELFRDAWELAIEALREIELKRSSARLALTKVGKRLGIRNSSSIGLAYKLVLETVRRQNFLDYLINLTLRNSSISDFDDSLRAFLRLYVYEVKFRGNKRFKKAVNVARIGRAVLGWRRLKEVEETLGNLLHVKPMEALKELNDTEEVSYRFFQPLWFVRYCFKLFGRYESLRFFKSTTSSTPTYIRLNTLKEIEEKELVERLIDEGITLEKTKGLLHTFKVVEEKRPLVKTLSFRDGLFYVQDKASCLAVEVASPRANMTVLDICAAPAAKTTYLAQLMENQGRIYSLDYSKRRMQVWRREVQRMGVKIASPLVADLYNSLPMHNVKADVLLLDPPCTSTGALSRIPSAKWRVSSRSIRHMAAIQWMMLNNCANYVKKGGSLVYSTCSVTVEENEILVERFLKWNPDFSFAETTPTIGLPGLRGQTTSQRLYPHIHECNGFFITKLEKQI